MLISFLLLAGAVSDSGGAEGGDAIFRFDEGTAVWNSINDGVMGGISSGRMVLHDDSAVFSGNLSLENNGGFASVRSRPQQHNMAGRHGIVLRVRGDGRTYGVRLRTDDRFDGVSYQAALPTRPGEWQETAIPFTAFRPVFRGRDVPDWPELDPAKIRTFGLILADGQPGDFRLQLDRIGTFLSADP